jgi:hypothetical protein
MHNIFAIKVAQVRTLIFFNGIEEENWKGTRDSVLLGTHKFE